MNLAVMLERPNKGHGSGAVLEKLLSAEDRKRIRFFYLFKNKFEYSAFPSTYVSPLAFFKATSMKQRRRLMFRHWRRWIFGSRLYSWYYRKRLKREISAYSPEVIVGVIADLTTARFFVWLADLFPNVRIRLIVWDLLDDGGEDSVFQELARLSGRIETASVVSEPLRRALGSKAGIDAEVHFPFVIKDRQSYLDYAGRSGIAMVGHVRTPGVYDFICGIGGRLQASIRSKPISWFGGQTIRRSGIAPVGIWEFVNTEDFLPDSEYYERLGQARWGLIPFDDSIEPSSSYTRYSIPSRIADFASVGTPLIFIGGAKSATGRLIEEYGLGLVLISDDSSAFERIDASINSAQEWGRLHRNCLEFSNKFGISTVRETFRRIFLG